MSLVRKTIFGGVLLMAAFIAGFFFLMRGCLSKYDERSAMPHALYFEKDTQSIIFSIVKFDKTISYSQDGGFIQKTVHTEYSIQANNAITGNKLRQQNVKDGYDIKNYPVEILGASNNQAWAFIGELMAFDPFTFTVTANIKMLEEKNPALKGKFPAERTYYSFNNSDNQIYFTANDGTKWQLNTQSLTATPNEYTSEDNSFKKMLKELEKAEKKNGAAIDSFYKNYTYNASKQYAAGKINYKEYTRLQGEYYKRRDTLYKQKDSIYNVKSALEKRNSGLREVLDKIESLKQTSLSYNSTVTNQDTNNGKWFGLYTKEEFEKLYDHIRYNPAYDETARRQFFSSNYSLNKNDDAILNKDSAGIPGASSFFLDGGFLLDKTTGVPIHLSNSENFLVLHKDKIGNEGNIQVSLVNANGNVQWTFNTQLHQWIDWICTTRQLFIFGLNNKELSSGECNVLWCISLSTGKAVMYDFFTDAANP
ncbi:MAG: PA2928 family protein [Panacibacter sp.]